ncbi:hypothetical protein [Diaphorobacter sp.]|uniref:hypothetical protein n=1 Tax=Diaphorobacter sp. TaxID=1934310 RepID=UPI0028A8283C|nr:hypothetical protein [Diaphorobacter sp.]
MKKTLFALISTLVLLPAAWSQDRIYRCGNEYTNNATQAKERGCKVVEGGNVTVLQGSRASGGAAPAVRAAAPAAPSAPSAGPRVVSQEQKARDSDARVILEDELRKAQSRHDELKKEYNDGFPQRTALEMRNPQGYIERTNDLKAALTRAEADVEGIKRELNRIR